MTASPATTTATSSPDLPLRATPTMRLFGAVDCCGPDELPPTLRTSVCVCSATTSAAYRSPKSVPAAAPDRRHALRVEVTLYHERGRGTDAMTVLDLAAGATLRDLLDATLVVFGYEDADHLAQLRLKPTRRKADARALTPDGDRDTVYSFQDEEDPDLEAFADTPAAALIGAGDVGYLVFDFGDPSWFQVRVVRSAAPDVGAPTSSSVSPVTALHLPAVQVEQYDDSCHL